MNLKKLIVNYSMKKGKSENYKTTKIYINIVKLKVSINNIFKKIGVFLLIESMCILLH